MANAKSNRQEQPAKHQTVGVGSLSFQGLLFTQWLTAINDNVFRWLVVGIGKEFAPGQEGYVLAAGLACFVAPYLLLAAPAGYLADRFCKRNVIVACKIAEILVMILGVIAIMVGSLWLLFVAVALMGAQSALFAPSKMGTIPEMLPADKISLANGWFGLSTVTATVIGMAIGCWLADQTSPYGQTNLWLSAVVLIGLATLGTLLSLFIKAIPAANPQRKFPWLFPMQTVYDMTTLYRNGQLFRVALGIVFFWGIGALAQLNIDQFASESGAFLEIDKAPLLVSMVLGVGVGSVLAGIWSAGRIELGLLWFSALGIVIFAALMLSVDEAMFHTGSLVSWPLVVACVLLILLGASAGIFDVPLAAFIQHRSPAESRGAILSAANFLIFSGMMVSAGLFQVMRLPVYSGSLENATRQLGHPRLTLEQKEKIDPLLTRFRAELDQQLATENEPQMETYLDQAAPSLRQALLARLLWCELEIRLEQDQPVPRTEYYKRFEGDEHLIKAVYDQAAGLPLLTARQIFLVIGLMAIPVFLYVLWRLPFTSIRFVAWTFCRFFLRLRVTGLENVPDLKAAVLVCNQGSRLDRILLTLATNRRVRLISWEPEPATIWQQRLSQAMGVIRITGGPANRQQRSADARRTILNGGLVGIFPERAPKQLGGSASYSDDIMEVTLNINVPVIPVYFDDRLGYILNHEHLSLFGKLARCWRQPVGIHFGKAETKPEQLEGLRHMVQTHATQTNEQKQESPVPPPISFVRRCKQRKRGWKIGDSTGVKLTGGSLLMRTLILRSLLRRHVLDDQEQFVGLLLPPSAPSVVVNAALSIDRRVAVNLNYTVSSDVMQSCIEQCGIKHVLTSRKVMEKLDLELDVELVYLEDLRDRVTLGDKLSAAFRTYVTPTNQLVRSLELDTIQPDDLLTVIFTSGSTGTPKGVMLTHGNIATNVAAIEESVRLTADDSLVGILPFFHSFGYTVTLWAVVCLPVRGAYHFSPLDSKQVGKLCKQFQCTCLLTTPTFLRSYLRRCTPSDFETLDIVVAGAEKLPTDLCDAFEKKFGVRPVEGYGATELSPLVSVNIPPSRSVDDGQVDCKEGTVGRPVPLVHAKIVDLDSGDLLTANKPGMLWICGPNVMRGYLGREDLTREVVVDGWYRTGDVAVLDDDGFIKITGRISRFSKIGGEMVPHIQIEEVLAEILKDDEQEDEGLKAAVTAVPDAKKGERLIVVHTSIELTPDQLCKRLAEEGLPNLYIPSADSFHQVEELPLLGTGKLDLKGIKQLALEVFEVKQPK